MMYGTTGKILRVDLTTGTWETETLTEEFYRLYPGGKALAGYILLNELPAHTDLFTLRWQRLLRLCPSPVLSAQGQQGRGPVVGDLNG